MLDKVIDVVRTVAPGIATALGGPLAGTAVQALSNAIFSRPDATQDEVAEAIRTADPELLRKMKQADQAFAVSMEELKIDLEQIAASDRDSARNREIKTKDTTPRILAYIDSIGFFVVLAYILQYGLPEKGGEALVLLLGSLATAWVMVRTYYYGSSSGSAAKNDIIERLKK